MVHRRAATATLDAPTREELDATRASFIPGRIVRTLDRRRDVPIPGSEGNTDAVAADVGSGATAGTGLVLPPQVLAGKQNLDGSPLTEADVFPFACRPSNSLPDFYFTYMPLETLQNYEADGKAGTSLMVAHDTWDEVAVGRSYDAWIEVDPVGSAEERAAAIERRGGVRFVLPSVDNEPLAWLFLNFFMQRGLNVGKKPNDELIRGILSGTLVDVSIGFVADVYRCSICHMDIYDWDWDGGGCPHIPGVTYDLGDLGEALCLARVEGGHLLEVSLVYKGATPGAQIVETKARMVASAGRLTSREARQLSSLEAKLGHRLVDLSEYRRALGKTVVVPALNNSRQPEKAVSAIHSQKKETPMVNRITTKNAGSRAQAPARPRRDTTTDPNAATTPSGNTTTDVETAVADMATASAESLASQIAALQTQIDASNAAIQGYQDEIAAEQASDAPDQATIDALNTQLQAEQDNLTALQDQQATLQQELDAINGVATDVGGTPTDAPTNTDASAMAGANALARARLLRDATSRLLSPLHSSVRTLTQDEAQPVIDALNQALTQIQALIVNSGANAVRTVPDQNIFNMLARAAGVPVTRVNFATVRDLVKHSEAGARYMKELQDDCFAAQVAVRGPEHVDEKSYRRMLSALNVEQLERELRGLDDLREQVFSRGRRVLPASSTGTVPVPNQRGADTQNGTSAPDPAEARRARRRRPII
jgi:hypothetical protein